MRKILTIAIREYKAMVATKAFVVSIVMMPILMLGGLVAVELLKNVGEVLERKIVVIDATGELLPILKAQAESRNASLKESADPSDGTEGESVESRSDDGLPTVVSGELLVIESIEPEKLNDELRIELSDRIRNGDLYAFVEIPQSITQPDGGPIDRVLFYSQDSSISDARGWFSGIINEYVKAKRLRAASNDPKILEIVAKASIPVNVAGMSLVATASDGSVVAAKEKNQMADIFLPLGAMMFMFLVIFMASQPMLEAVLEEKSLRIAEVLLGSASPFQLMFGKLLGTVGGSMTVFLIYLLGGFLMARNRGWLDSVPLELIPYFLTYQVFGVLFYAAIFMAVGASVSQLKEAQALLLPVWMMLMLPIFIWIFIVRNPNGMLATGLSFFPPATSTTMILRLATGQTIPLWHCILSILILLASTIIVVILAGRIFRVGMLWQGKVPRFTEILRWAIRG